MVSVIVIVRVCDRGARERFLENLFIAGGLQVFTFTLTAVPIPEPVLHVKMNRNYVRFFE